MNNSHTTVQALRKLINSSSLYATALDNTGGRLEISIKGNSDICFNSEGLKLTTEDGRSVFISWIDLNLIRIEERL